MNSLKSILSNCYYRFKFKKSHLRIGKGAYVYGKDAYFEGYNKIGNNSSFYGALGYGSYIGRHSHINATIGRYCCISDRVNTAPGAHPTEVFVSVHPSFYSTGKQSGFSYVKETCFDEYLTNPVDGKTTVYIGNDVWIGCDVTLIGGIRIGDGAVIAAGSIVNRDIEPYTVVGGVPAKPIRKRFNEEQVEFLCDFRWWDKDKCWIAENHEYFKDIEKIMDRYKA